MVRQINLLFCFFERHKIEITGYFILSLPQVTKLEFFLTISNTISGQQALATKKNINHGITIWFYTKFKNKNC